MKVLAWKLFGALLMERDASGEAKISLGRFILLIAFGLAVVKWSADKEIQSTLLTIIEAAMGYVMGGKAIGSVKDWINKPAPVATAAVMNPPDAKTNLVYPTGEGENSNQ